MIFRVNTYNFVVTILYAFFLLNLDIQFPRKFLKQVLYWLGFHIKSTASLREIWPTLIIPNASCFLSQPGPILEKKIISTQNVIVSFPILVLAWGPQQQTPSIYVALKNPRKQTFPTGCIWLAVIFCEACTLLPIGNYHIEFEVSESLG